ncbi:hypothetical protein FNV43_RR04395 [Rhamnella rubrinervis]|uniref:Bromo domain-containing protein n=1 Tax=Rhamnella rubrinervis TaxID=2594499 RepID=A0A8K0MQ74_9ROSA|nr:hypothetical protein FNV43_RR04395 [Rhamnella rubrinervis]
MEDSANSLPDVKISASGNLSKKAGSIKIKSSKVSGSSLNQTSDALTARGIRHDPRYDKQELDASLTVIKKVMKMDAAEPFNVPVNPVALGIPDYFDVIDTPMDFGTICSNLEKGVKYMNSEDVFKDVQYIWDNCYKYNNKGDYILDLMRRVKKNFTKYWTAAGLFSGHPKDSNGVDSIQENTGGPSKGSVHVKGGQSKKMTKKGHGRRHKCDCLCAICVLKRRRREREENERIAKGQTGVDDNKLAQENRQESLSLPLSFFLKESSLAESRSGDNSSSNMDESSVDPNADVEVEEKEVKMEVSEQHYASLAEEDVEVEEEEEEEEEEDEDNEIDMKNEDNNETQEQLDKSRDEPNSQSQLIIAEKIADGVQTDKEDALFRQEEAIVADQRMKHKVDGTLLPSMSSRITDGTKNAFFQMELFITLPFCLRCSVLHFGMVLECNWRLNAAALLQEWRERHEKFKEQKLRFEDPMVLDLCGILFPDDCGKSIWSGPHSLVQDQSTTRTSSVHAAIDMLMK